MKVRELKNLLMARGFKVWVDMDHFEDFDGDEVGWAEEVCSNQPLALVNSCKHLFIYRFMM